MNQPELFHETLTDALREVVDALGGPKAVGAAMRPEKSIDEARRWLIDCLNPDRRERLDPDQTLWLLREGRRVGCHSAMRFIARECLYADPVPIEPIDRHAELMRAFNSHVEQLAALARQLESAGWPILKVAK